MPGTKRVRIARRRATPISPHAAALFRKMAYLPASEEEMWWYLHDQLHTALNLPPHVWPCVGQQGPKHAGPPPDADPLERMALLRQAARMFNGVADANHPEDHPIWTPQNELHENSVRTSSANEMPKSFAATMDSRPSSRRS